MNKKALYSVSFKANLDNVTSKVFGFTMNNGIVWVPFSMASFFDFLEKKIHHPLNHFSDNNVMNLFAEDEMVLEEGEWKDHQVLE